MTEQETLYQDDLDPDGLEDTEDEEREERRSRLVYPVITVAIIIIVLLLWRSCDLGRAQNAVGGVPPGTVFTVEGNAVTADSVYRVSYTFVRYWNSGGERLAVLKLRSVKWAGGGGVEPVHKGEHIVARIDGDAGSLRTGKNGTGTLRLVRDKGVFRFELAPR